MVVKRRRWVNEYRGGFLTCTKMFFCRALVHASLPDRRPSRLCSSYLEEGNEK